MTSFSYSALNSTASFDVKLAGERSFSRPASGTTGHLLCGVFWKAPSQGGLVEKSEMDYRTSA